MVREKKEEEEIDVNRRARVGGKVTAKAEREGRRGRGESKSENQAPS